MPWRAKAYQIRSRASPSTLSRRPNSVVKKRTQYSMPRSMNEFVTTEAGGSFRTPKLAGDRGQDNFLHAIGGNVVGGHDVEGSPRPQFAAG